MKFLLDQDVYAVTAHHLESLGHDVLRVADIELSRASDAALLEVARERSRILVTRDRDFGGLVFVHGFGSGVIYLRVLPSSLPAIHEELARVLAMHSEDALRRAFVVVEAGRHRIRHLQG